MSKLLVCFFVTLFICGVPSIAPTFAEVNRIKGIENVAPAPGKTGVAWRGGGMKLLYGTPRFGGTVLFIEEVDAPPRVFSDRSGKVYKILIMDDNGGLVIVDPFYSGTHHDEDLDLHIIPGNRYIFPDELRRFRDMMLF